MLRVEKAVLAAALTAAGGIVKANHTIPILQNVLIERQADGIVARGSSLDMEISAACKAEVADDFMDFTCPAQTFSDFVRNAPAEEVTFEAVVHAGQMTAVTMRSGRSRLRIPALPATDYPKLDNGNYDHKLTLAASLLGDAISAVRYAVETAADRPLLRGVALQPHAEGIDVVATDGLRLERRLLPAIAFDDDVDLVKLPRITLPAATADRIVKLMDESADVTVELSEMKVRVTSGSQSLVSKLIEGTYPDWKRMLPPDNDRVALVGNRILSDAIGRVLLATPDASNGIAFTFSDGRLLLWARDMSAGEAEDEIAVDFEGEHKVGLHGKQVREALSHMKGDTLEIHMGGNNSRILVHPPEDSENYAVIAALRMKC